MFTLWYAYLGYQEYRRRGYFQWSPNQWWKIQDKTAGLSTPTSPATDIQSSSSTASTANETDHTSSTPSSTRDQNEIVDGKSSVGGSAKESKEQEISRPSKSSHPVTPSSPLPPSAGTTTTALDERAAFKLPKISNENLKFAERTQPKTDIASTDSLISKEKAMENPKEKEVQEEEEEDDDDEDFDEEFRLKAKDSKLLIAAESLESKRPVRDPVVCSLPETKTIDKKKISFTDRPSDEIHSRSDVGSSSAVSEQDGRNDPVAQSTSSIRSPASGRGRMYLEGSEEPMRCWLTEGDHPDHPADLSVGSHNVKLLSNRSRDSADSILRDSDEFLMNERNISRQTSWPKKVSISEEPPTTFVRDDIPPADDHETETDTSPAAKLKREVELAAAAAAALKEDWRRKKMKRDANDPIDPDDDETIIFGDSDDPENDAGQLLQLSDEEDETSDKTLRLDPPIFK